MTTFDLITLILRLSPAIPMVSFGIHQLQHPLDWSHNLPKFMKSRLDKSQTRQFMLVHASLNILLGLWLVSGWFLVASAITALLWYLSLIPFVWRQKWSNGVRDLAIALPLVALLLLI